MKKNITYYLALSFCLLQSLVASAQNIGINATGAAPDSSAMLDIVSTDKGLLIPRMDSTARKNILLPAQGLLVFDSTYNSFWYYNGSAWQSIAQSMDQQDLSRSNDSLYLTNDLTGVDLSALKQDFIFANDSLQLTGSPSKVDMSSFTQNNLGKHIATQSIQLNGHHLSHDGDPGEGILIDGKGQVGINSLFLPEAPLHVAIGQNPTVNTSIVNPGITTPVGGTVWQSFSLPVGGYLHTFIFYNYENVPPTQSSYNVNVYEGEGTGGTLLYSGTSTLVGNNRNDCNLPNIPMQKDSMFTIEIIKDPTNTEAFGTNRFNNYRRGQLSSNAIHDLVFNLYIIEEATGYQFSKSAVVLNEYSLPITDGNANEVLQLDAFGNTNWTDLVTPLGDEMGPHYATQNLQLNNNWLGHNGQNGSGLYIDSTGQVGFNKTPSANLEVAMGPPSDFQLAAFTSSTYTYQNVLNAWQSFTCTEDGVLDDLLLTFISFPGAYGVTLTLFEGEGTAGATLYSTTATINIPTGHGEVSFAPPANQSIALVGGQKYTIQLSNASRWQQVAGDPYAGGYSSFDSNQDFAFKVYGRDIRPFFRVTDTGVNINDYTLPATDGNADQVWTTDGAGTLTWTTLTSVPNQQLTLSGHTLTLSDGGSPISLTPYINADNLGNHFFSQDFSLGNHWIQNNTATDEGLQLNTNNALLVQSPASKTATFHHITGGNGSFLEVNNRAGTRALFGPEGNGFTGGSTTDVAIGNWGTYGDFQLFTSALERMRVDSVGKVGLSRTPTTNLLEVNGNASKTTAGGWLANSDARLKKNIQALDPDEMLEKLLSLQGVSYEWEDDQTGNDRPEGIQYGFTAQNIQEVFPELVSEDNQGYLQTAYGTYDAMTVEALRALNEEIEALAAANKLLETKLQKEWTAFKARLEEAEGEEASPTQIGEE